MPDKFLSGICGYEFFAKYMRSKILSKRALLIVVPSGFVLFTALLLNFIPKDSTQGSSALLIENVAASSSQKQASVGLPALPAGKPARLKIPVIGVDSAVIPVGLTSNGAMGVPKGPAEVAWFNLGPRPGESGSAVIAGHYGWKNNIPAVFDNLHKLRKGDKIFIEDEKGMTITFVVRKIRIYGKDEVASDVFGSNDGKARLNLITCAGAWNKEKKTFSKRLIVFTEL